jgi:hypothetical protein
MSNPPPETLAARAAVKDMQLRTRKQRDFDTFEAMLAPIHARPPLSLATKAMDIIGLLSHFGKRNPLQRPVAAGDVVWMLDNVAFKQGSKGSWQAEFVTAVYENEPKCTVIDVARVLARIIGLAETAQELATIEERLLPFLWDVRVGRKLAAVHGDTKMVLGPTDSRGISADNVRLPRSAPGSIARTSATVPHGVSGILQSWTYFAEPDGWAVISGMYPSKALECAVILPK